MRYHLKFLRIKPFVKQRTAKLIKDWGYIPEYRQWASLRAWMILVCFDPRGYAMQIPDLVVDEKAGCGYYIPASNEIHMAYPSIITLLHEFRHAMQAQGLAGRYRDAEDDARGWSLSLYNSVAPRTLRRLVNEGKVLHLSPADFEAT